jgi:hypothetical protein
MWCTFVCIDYLYSKAYRSHLAERHSCTHAVAVAAAAAFVAAIYAAFLQYLSLNTHRTGHRQYLLYMSSYLLFVLQNNTL